MFYRVDYALAVVFLGFLAGIAFHSAGKRYSPNRLATFYHALLAALVVIRTLVYAGSALASNPHPWTITNNLFGDAIGFTFGALFGLAVRRNDARDFLTDQHILDSLKLMLAFTFGMAAIAKAFALTAMTDFFTQSGYSVAFLKFIVLAEAFGAIGLLLPWASTAAIAGLSIDMFGAILTHLHNGDPLNDSTGAIGMLIRLLALATLCLWRPSKSRTPRKTALFVAAGAISCFLIAWGGSITARHLNPPAVAAPLTK